MKQYQQVTAIIEREDNGYVSLCQELDIASLWQRTTRAKVFQRLGLIQFYDKTPHTSSHPRMTCSFNGFRLSDCIYRQPV